MRKDSKDNLFMKYQAEQLALEKKEDACKEGLKRLEEGLEDLDRILHQFPLFDNECSQGYDTKDLIELENEKDFLVGKLHAYTEERSAELRTELNATRNEIDACHENYLEKLHDADNNNSRDALW